MPRQPRHENQFGPAGLRPRRFPARHALALPRPGARKEQVAVGIPAPLLRPVASTRIRQFPAITSQTTKHIHLGGLGPNPSPEKEDSWSSGCARTTGSPAGTC